MVADHDRRSTHQLDDATASLQMATAESAQLRDLLQDHRRNIWANVCTVKNRNTLINKLFPPEILGYVFLELASIAAREAAPESTNEDTPVTFSSQRNLWFSVMRVCRLWKEIALATPLLWATISNWDHWRGNRESYFSEWLQRAGGVQLNLNIVRCLESLAQAASRCHRLRILHVTIHFDKVDHLRQLSVAAPCLLSLSIAILDGGQAVLPSLFSGNVSRMRHLGLTNVWQIANNRFRDLTHLTIRSVSYASHDDPGLSQVSLMLRESPNLEDLYLEDVHLLNGAPQVDSAPSLRNTRIPLPALRKLRLHRCGRLLIQRIMRQLELAAKGITVVCFSVDSPNDAFLPIVSSFIPSHPRFAPFFDATALSLSRDIRGASISALNPATSVDILLQCRAGEQESGLFLASIRDSSFAFGALRELWLSGVDRGTLVWWQQFFGSLASLTKLVIQVCKERYHEDNALVLRLSRTLSGLEVAVPGMPYPVPSLEELHCDMNVLDHRCVNAISFAVARRNRSGHRLRLLRFTHGHGDCDADVVLATSRSYFPLKLQENADNVEWVVIEQPLDIRTEHRESLSLDVGGNVAHRPNLQRYHQGRPVC